MDQMEGHFNRAKAVKRIEQLSTKKELLKERERKIEKEERGITHKLEQEYRDITEVTDLVLLLRNKITANDELKLLMDNHRIPIEKLALVLEAKEKLNYNGHPMKGSPVLGKLNSFKLWRRYVYGGPDDQFKVLFRDCHNGRYLLTGFIFNPKFPMTRKAKPKENQKLSKKDFGLMMGFRRPA